MGKKVVKHDKMALKFSNFMLL